MMSAKKLLHLAAPIVLASVFSTVSAPLRAQTTYFYNGNPFTAFAGGLSCPPECHITGSFTVAQPLAPNLNQVTITPISFRFTDGNVTLTVVLPANLDSQGLVF